MSESAWRSKVVERSGSRAKQGRLGFLAVLSECASDLEKTERGYGKPSKLPIRDESTMQYVYDRGKSYALGICEHPVPMYSILL